MKPCTLQRSITWQRIHFLILSPAAPRCPCFGDSEVQIDLVISWNEEVVLYGNTVQVIFTGIWKIEMWSHCNIQGSEKLLSSCWAAISVPRGLWLFSSQNLWAQRDRDQVEVQDQSWFCQMVVQIKRAQGPLLGFHLFLWYHWRGLSCPLQPSFEHLVSPNTLIYIAQ